MWATSIIFIQLPKANNRPLGENSPNLVTLGPGLPDFYCYNIPQRGKIYQITTSLPNDHKTYQMAVGKISQGTINFNSKALQNLPNLGFLV
jgi:hypothetical protein